MSTDPVSFSIKIKEECQSTALQNTVLPQDASDDEEKHTSAASFAHSASSTTIPEHVQKAIKLVESQLMARNAQIAAALALRHTSSSSLPVKNVLPNNTSIHNTKSSMVSVSSALSISSGASASKAEAERNMIFEQQQQQRHKELKKAEEKVKDKLAKLAREKLGLVSKEKQLQLERKKKAMAFLNQIKGNI